MRKVKPKYKEIKQKHMEIKQKYKKIKRKYRVFQKKTEPMFKSLSFPYFFMKLDKNLIPWSPTQEKGCVKFSKLFKKIQNYQSLRFKKSNFGC